MSLVVPRNQPLADLFSQATSKDLDVLADLITDNGNGRIALDSGIKMLILKRKQEGSLQSISDVLENEIRAFGGNSVANLFRSGGLQYQELAADVAKKLGGKPGEEDDVFAVEDVVIKQAIEKFSPEDTNAQKTGGVVLTRVLSNIVQNIIASSSVMGVAAASGAASGVVALGARAASATLPPLAIATTAYTFLQASGPAFRITIPAVVQIAKMRRRQVEADFLTYTESLRACL